MRIFGVLLLPLVAAACTGTPDCLQGQPYQQAEAFPPLRAPAGMSVPEADPNLQVPEVAEGPVGAYPAEQGSGDENKEQARRRCLSSPPPMSTNG